MKEKTKQILRYVACGLGGLALGIGLLGGLSMCATSSKKTNESVNTILTTERVRHNVSGTTPSGYLKLTFEIPSTEYILRDNEYNYRVYSVDRSNYNLTYTDGSTHLALQDGYANVTALVQELQNEYTPNYEYRLNLLEIEGANKPRDNQPVYYWTYISFLGYNVLDLEQIPFLLNTEITKETWFIDRWVTASRTAQPKYLLNYQPNQTLMASETPLPNGTRLNFQDIESYYQELGYQDGYSAGYSEGETAGNSAGYSSGYSEGHTAGYSEGYDDAYAEKDSGIAFTSCGVYPNAQVTLATDETIGNFKYMYLCHYITKPGYDEHTIYIMWTTNANTGQYLGEVIDRNDTDSYNPAVTLGSFTQQATSSVTITATQDMEFGLWVGYITTFHNRGEITNSILWFQGGTSESDMQIYQNGYDEGYQNGNQQGQETGYEQGYERGQEVGDAEGYSRGYTEGFNQTNTKNVFSLFTSAFDSVASFFDLKIFGFLPLYWFFLAPLFIALISLLMRMVKH